LDTAVNRFIEKNEKDIAILEIQFLAPFMQYEKVVHTSFRVYTAVIIYEDNIKVLKDDK